MPVETALRAIEECTAGETNAGIIFFGGEPLLREEAIFEILDECERRRPLAFHYKVTTNGTLLSPEFLSRAMERRLHVALSCDGLPAAHDRHRVREDGTGTSADVMRALGLLLACQPYAPVMMTVNPDTAADYAEGVMDLCARGAKYVVSTVNFQADWDAAARRRLWKAYRRLAEWYLEVYRREEKIYFAAFDKRIATRIWPGRGASCQLGRRQISVAPDGTYYPCVQFVGRTGYELGRVGQGLDAARRTCVFERNERAKPSCAWCALEGRCNNRCGCLNISTTETLDAVPPFYCEHERFLVPLVDGLAERLYAERNALFLQRHYNPAFPIASILEDMLA
jgi:uncharacterized protein